MDIHQLSVSYDAAQDRMLLRVNTLAGQEMRLWFTRRLMVGLWPMLSQTATEHLLKLEAPSPDLADQGLRRMVAQFRRDEFVQQADFATPYQAQAALPLGAEPLLVTRVDVTPQASGNLRLDFHEQPAPGDQAPRQLQVEVAARLMHGLVHLLSQALAQSRWQEPLEVLPGTAAALPGDGDAPQSRYLN